MIAINYRDPRPIYEQIQAELRRLMLTGHCRPAAGFRLCGNLPVSWPSIPTPSSALTVNWN